MSRGAAPTYSATEVARARNWLIAKGYTIQKTAAGVTFVCDPSDDQDGYCLHGRNQDAVLVEAYNDLVVGETANAA